MNNFLSGVDLVGKKVIITVGKGRKTFESVFTIDEFLPKRKYKKYKLSKLNYKGQKITYFVSHNQITLI